MTQQINILALAVNERMSNVLEFFFEHHARGLYQLVSSGQRVDVVVADLDNYNGQHYSLDELLDKYPDTPVVVFSINAIDQQTQDIAQGGSVFFLKKPIALDQLKDTLSQCRQLVGSKTVSTGKKPSVVQAKQKAEKNRPSAAPRPSGTPKAQAKQPVQTTQENKPVEVEKNAKPTREKRHVVVKPASLSEKIPTAVNVSKQLFAPVVAKKAVGKLLPLRRKSEKDASDASDVGHKKAAIEAKARINSETNGQNLPFIGRRADVDLTDAEMVKKIRFNPQNYVYYHLKEIIANKKRGTVLHVNIEDKCDFFISADNRHIKSLTPPSKRKSVASYFFQSLQIEQREVDEDWDNIKGELMQSDALLWAASLWAARGRLPIDARLNQPVRLKHWPDITRYLDFPYAVKMAAVWSKHTLSIREIAEQLQIPQRYIFSFYVACEAIDVLDFEQGEIPFYVTEAEKEVVDKSVGVFKRILTHIGK